MVPSFATPARMLLAVVLFNLAVGLAATLLVLKEPWLGMSLAPGEKPDSPVRVEQTVAALSSFRGAALLRISDLGGKGLDLRSSDLIEEPDSLDTYSEMAVFFQRQQVLRDVLMSDVQLLLRGDDGAEHVIMVRPISRPLASLPLVFWFQLAVGALGCLIGAWVFLLRPSDWSARMFALTGFSFPVFTMSAAIYSGRALALPGDGFRLLSSINHLGALMFGCALVALFLCYPRPLVRPRRLLWLPVIFGLWFLADALRIAPDQDWGSRFPVMLQMLAAIALGIVQWRRNRGDAVHRAALRWLILASCIGCGLFVFTTAGSRFLGWLPPIAQGYSFGFFLLMHGGLALGVGRYRLFELDTWAYRILLWVGGMVALVALDGLLVAALGMAPNAALGLTLMVCGGLYFPFRHFLWQRLTAGRATRIEELMPDLVSIAFLATPAARAEEWRSLLDRLYHSLRIEPVDDAGGKVAISDDGLRLLVPGDAGMSGLVLEFRDQGRHLFSPRDAAFVESLRELMARAAAARDAYERGADEERHRIARDMHDDVGARLLMLIHRARGDDEADIARAAMSDLRTAIASLELRAKPLLDAMADWRGEVADRCEAADVILSWSISPRVPAVDLNPRQNATLERVLRETVTNALKHGSPGRIAVKFDWGEEGLVLAVEDDGRGGPPVGEWQAGRGLRNMKQRLLDLGGSIAIAAAEIGGARVRAAIPIEAGKS